jgi:hypothetical protein
VPVFEQQLAVMTRGVRAFLDLRAGVARVGAAPPEERQGPEEDAAHRQLEEARRKPGDKDPELAGFRSRLDGT